MAIQHPDIQPAVNHSVQVAIAGAGPVGLMMANYLGQMGIDVLVVEKLDKLIDYPRAIGIDDEALRTMQSVGLVDDVLPHTTPWHAMRFLTPKGRCFADIQPMTDEFGWPRRNAFIQPQVDAVMLEGLSRFPNVRCLFARELEAFSQQNDEVTLHLKTAEGQRETVKAQWLVACDGGASFVRRTLNVPFEGKTAPNQWIVVDIANDPLSTPHIYLCCDPVRPYVSAALPHAVRRFEFMVMPGETEEQLREPQNMRKLLSKVLPNPDNVELIRQRVYTHNARLAQRFRIDRVLLAGDAAHIMDAVSLLRSVESSSPGEEPLLGRRVVVYGGGNTAMDSVRTARRMGAENVMLVYRRSEDEMPARREEVKHAKEEGVRFLTLHNPLEYEGDEKGNVRLMRLQRMELGEPDESGRRSPVAVDGAVEDVPVDLVIVSVGVSPNPLIPNAIPELEVSRRGTIVVDESTMRSSLPDIYAGGDIVRGGATVILAMGDGRRAAAEMDKSLQNQ